MDARRLLASLLNPGTFHSWDAEPVDVRPAPAYAAELAAARDRTGLDESVITGEGLVRGRRVAVAACEFGFLGGSIGVAAGERLVLAIERATAECLPLIALPASGGTRMQEGTVAFLQMVKITAAVAEYTAAHLPYLVYLRHPTTGGVFASWGSLGHLTLAEPGALIGFLGPRVYEFLTGAQIPKDVQTAENLRAHGLVDAVVSPAELAAFVDRALTVIAAPAGAAEPPQADAIPDVPAWESVLRSRRADRPDARDLLRLAATDMLPLGGQEPGLALARFGGTPCVVIGQDRQGPPPGPAALRTARRGMRLAAGLGLPLVTVIDTPGAELSPAAEEGGLAREIAHCLSELVTLPTPTLSLLLGQGTGGAALALLPADRVLAAQHAWLAPLAPEGASAIVHRDTAHAPELAGAQRIRSGDMADDGIVDLVIAEPSAGHEAFCRRTGRVLGAVLAELATEDPGARLDRRRRRYRRLGLRAPGRPGA